MQLATIQRRFSLEERVRRSEQLASHWTFAGEILRTYRLVLEFQQSLSQVLKSSKVNGQSHDHLPHEIALSPFLSEFQTLMRATTNSGPGELAASTREIERSDLSRWEERLQEYWNGSYNGNDGTELFLLHAFLQPIAEHFAANAEIPSFDVRPRSCPFCNRKPACGVLRPEGDGARRSLVCSFCATEWDYRRLVCPACEQEQIEKLPVYTADEFPYIRVEACDACKTFVKTIDMTKDGRAVPIVDEIASVPLTLWAQEKGYQKLQPNLLLM